MKNRLLESYGAWGRHLLMCLVKMAIQSRTGHEPIVKQCGHVVQETWAFFALIGLRSTQPAQLPMHKISWRGQSPCWAEIVSISRLAGLLDSFDIFSPSRVRLCNAMACLLANFSAAAVEMQTYEPVFSYLFTARSNMLSFHPNSFCSHSADLVPEWRSEAASQNRWCLRAPSWIWISNKIITIFRLILNRAYLDHFRFRVTFLF